MISINVVRDKNGFIWEFVVKGHAGYDKPGRDIVCSAITAIATTAVGALEDIVGIKDSIVEEGYLRCTIPKDISQEDKAKVKLILETIIIGFKQIEFSYKKYVSVLDKEV